MTLIEDWVELSPEDSRLIILRMSAAVTSHLPVLPQFPLGSITLGSYNCFMLRSLVLEARPKMGSSPSEHND